MCVNDMIQQDVDLVGGCLRSCVSRILARNSSCMHARLASLPPYDCSQNLLLPLALLLLAPSWPPPPGVFPCPAAPTGDLLQVLVEFAVNDPGQSGIFRDPERLCYERLLRKLLEFPQRWVEALELPNPPLRRTPQCSAASLPQSSVHAPLPLCDPSSPPSPPSHNIPPPPAPAAGPPLCC